MQEDAGREAGERLVECGLVGEAARRRDEVRQHRDRSPVQRQRKPFQLAERRRLDQCLAEERCGFGGRGHGACRPPFPASRFKRQKGLDPRVDPLRILAPLERQRSLFGKPGMLAAKFLALLASQRTFQIGFRAQRRVQQGPLFAHHQSRGTAIFEAQVHQALGQRLLERHCRQVQEQRAIVGRCLVGPIQQSLPEQCLASGAHQRCTKEGIGVLPRGKVSQGPALIAALHDDRHEPDQPAAGPYREDACRTVGIEGFQCGKEIPVFEEGVRRRRRIGKLRPKAYRLRACPLVPGLHAGDQFGRRARQIGHQG